MTAILAKFQAWLAAAGVALAVIVGAFFYGRSDGKDAAREAQNRAEAKARTQSKEVENEVNRLGDGAVADRLAGWMRDGKR